MNSSVTPDAGNEAGLGKANGRMKRMRRLSRVAVCAIVLGTVICVACPSLPRNACLSALGVYYTYLRPIDLPTADLGPSIPSEARNGAVIDEVAETGFTITIRGPSPIWNVPFIHEDVTTSEAVMFSEQIDRAIGHTGDAFDWSQQIRALAPHGSTDLPPANYNRCDLLAHATAGKPLTCYYFAHLYQATCVVRGFTSRVLGLSSDGTEFHHAVVEVYMPELEKWVLIDCDFNIAYQDLEGRWLNAIEVQEHWQRYKKIKDHSHLDDDSHRTLTEQVGIVAVSLGGAGKSLRDSNMQPHGSGMNLRLYEWILFDCRNNFLSGKYPVGHPDAVRQYFVGPGDSAPQIASNAEPVSKPASKYIYPHVGATALQLFTMDDGTLGIALGTLTPGFEFFEMKTSGKSWKKQLTLRLPLQLTEEHFEFRTVNSRGLRGPIRAVDVTPIE